MTLLTRLIKALPEDARVVLANTGDALAVRLETHDGAGRTIALEIVWPELELATYPEELIVERLRARL